MTHSLAIGLPGGNDAFGAFGALGLFDAITIGYNSPLLVGGMHASPYMPRDSVNASCGHVPVLVTSGELEGRVDKSQRKACRQLSRPEASPVGDETRRQRHGSVLVWKNIEHQQ